MKLLKAHQHWSVPHSHRITVKCYPSFSHQAGLSPQIQRDNVCTFQISLVLMHTHHFNWKCYSGIKIDKDKLIYTEREFDFFFFTFLALYSACHVVSKWKKNIIIKTLQRIIAIDWKIPRTFCWCITRQMDIGWCWWYFVGAVLSSRTFDTWEMLPLYCRIVFFNANKYPTSIASTTLYKYKFSILFPLSIYLCTVLLG